MQASAQQAKRSGQGGLRRNGMLHLFLLPSVILLIVYSYIPMAGIVIAFQNYKTYKGIGGSEWVGLEHFRTMFMDERIVQIIENTLVIALSKMAAGWVAPLIFALLLNEVRILLLKRAVQTLVYLPHFLSWVILGGILTDMLSEHGIVNAAMRALGLPSVFFLGSGGWFRFTLVVSDIWKEFGFGTIIYLAALAGVNPALYEAAEIDGASRLRQTFHVTLPSIIKVGVVIGTLSLGNVLNAGFDQVFNMINPIVAGKGEIIDTYVYKVGLLQGAFSFATAVGLFKSVVSLVLIALTYRLAYKYANYRIF
ncbi:ABC transporter permease [Cohnella phaseoli]|uniref:Putative aldouronate transport system permease protein n=1 Tax=Cohnella phaseoli TaxID=456490 RepID=A0A3D9JNU3_9BACL|nr:putative aldouronate transport system permease protein [Cohnella phaseoli]